MKRILALMLCALYIFISGTALAADLPESMYITKADLLELCRETNGGKGLLATGTASDVPLRINFGSRPEKVQYYGESFTELSSVGPGPFTWLLAGADEGSLLLYSEEPLLAAGTLFSASADSEDYEGTLADPNHWGASDLRKSLIGFVERFDVFPDWSRI